MIHIGGPTHGDRECPERGVRAVATQASGVLGLGQTGPSPLRLGPTSHWPIKRPYWLPGGPASPTQHLAWVVQGRAWKCGTQSAAVAATLAGSAPRWFAGSLSLPVLPSRLMFSSSASTPPHFASLDLLCLALLPCRRQRVTVRPCLRS